MPLPPTRRTRVDTLPAGPGVRISTIPVEILAEILANLDYRTLKLHVSPVCRLFRAIILDASTNKRHTKLSAALFADDGSSSSTSLGVRAHPCFERLFFSNIPSNRKLNSDRNVSKKDLVIPLWLVGFYTRYGRFVPLSETTAANENATSPGSDRVYFDNEYVQVGPGPLEPPPSDINSMTANTSGTPVTVVELVNMYLTTMEKNGYGMRHVAKYHTDGWYTAGAYKLCNLVDAKEGGPGFLGDAGMISLTFHNIARTPRA